MNACAAEEKKKKVHSTRQFVVHQIPLGIFVRHYPTDPPVRANRDFPKGVALKVHSFSHCQKKSAIVGIIGFDFIIRRTTYQQRPCVAMVTSATSMCNRYGRRCFRGLSKSFLELAVGAHMDVWMDKKGTNG